MVRNILHVLAELARESDSAATAILRQRIVQSREQFSQPLHPQEERLAAAECVTACEQYLRGVEKDRLDRESEIMAVVRILREAAKHFIGDSSVLNERLLSSTDRLKSLSRLDDIRDLKKELAAEVSFLERAVQDKKQRDAQLVARLSERVDVLQSDLVKAEEEAATDALTKVANRGTFDTTLARLVAAAHADGTPLTLAMVDIDHFKAINDTHGHPVGDRVLVCAAEWLRSAIRQTDLVARYGGEEFAVLLPGASLQQCERRLNDVLRAIAARQYEYDAGGIRRVVRFTVSVGVAQLGASESQQDLVSRADEALYEAKHKGRNRVVARKPSRLGRLFSGA
ncbi:MAG: GGDEF domain-containing protein [Vicinamibacterales bacterium]